MSREAFEAWCCKRWGGDRGSLTIREDGEYLSGPVQFALEAWQATRAAALEEAAEVADAHATCEGIGQRIAVEIRALKEKE